MESSTGAFDCIVACCNRPDCIQPRCILYNSTIRDSMGQHAPSVYDFATDNQLGSHSNPGWVSLPNADALRANQQSTAPFSDSPPLPHIFRPFINRGSVPFPLTGSSTPLDPSLSHGLSTFPNDLLHEDDTIDPQQSQDLTDQYLFSGLPRAPTETSQAVESTTPPTTPPRSTVTLGRQLGLANQEGSRNSVTTSGSTTVRDYHTHANIPPLVIEHGSSRVSILKNTNLSFQRIPTVRTSLAPSPAERARRPYASRLDDATFVIRLQWNRHSTEIFQNNFLVIDGFWSLWLDSKSWSFELVNLESGKFERLKFFGRHFHITRLWRCTGCQNKGLTCDGTIPCGSCIHEARTTGSNVVSCYAEARPIGVSEYDALGMTEGSIVVRAKELLPFNTNGRLQLKNHVARTIRHHTIVTGRRDVAIVLSGLPTRRDREYIYTDPGKFVKYTEDEIDLYKRIQGTDGGFQKILDLSQQQPASLHGIEEESTSRSESPDTGLFVTDEEDNGSGSVLKSVEM